MRKLIGLLLLWATAAQGQCTLTSNITSGFVGVSGYGLVDKSVVTQTDGFGISLDSHQQIMAEYGLASHRTPNGDSASHSIYGAVIKLDLGNGVFEYDTWGAGGGHAGAGITYRQFGLVQTAGGLMLQFNTWSPLYNLHHSPPTYWFYTQLYNQPYTVGTSPKYLRLVRQATTSVIEADTSTDGVSWTEVATSGVGVGDLNEDIGIATYGMDNHSTVHVFQLENVNIDGAGTAINYDERNQGNGVDPLREFVGGAIQEVQAGGNVGLLANPVGIGNQQSWVQLSAGCTFDSTFQIQDSFAATGGGGVVFPSTSACIGLSKCYLTWSNPLNYPNGGEYLITVPSSGLFNIEHSWTFTGDNFAALSAGDQKFDISIKTQ